VPFPLPELSLPCLLAKSYPRLCSDTTSSRKLSLIIPPHCAHTFKQIWHLSESSTKAQCADAQLSVGWINGWAIFRTQMS
jgi:putative lipase involved disintegration of autophagic bodies